MKEIAKNGRHDGKLRAKVKVGALSQPFAPRKFLKRGGWEEGGEEEDLD